MNTQEPHFGVKENISTNVIFIMQEENTTKYFTAIKIIDVNKNSTESG